MIISDEMLSAFLDAELSDEQMEYVRSALETDDELVMRLAELTQADQWVIENAAVIDNTEVSDDLLKIARTLDKKIAQQQPESTQINRQNDIKVVSLSRWKQFNKNLQKHYALAAGVAIIFVVGNATFMQPQQPSGTIAMEITQILNQVPSGAMLSTEQGDNITANLSFINHAGNYCRQYQRQNKAVASINIACKENTKWQLKISKEIIRDDNTQAYRAASNKALLDKEIDKMISGSAMDSKQEQNAIANNWQTNQIN